MYFGISRGEDRVDRRAVQCGRPAANRRHGSALFVCTPKDAAAEEPCARKILSTRGDARAIGVRHRGGDAGPPRVSTSAGRAEEKRSTPASSAASSACWPRRASCSESNAPPGRRGTPIASRSRSRVAAVVLPVEQHSRRRAAERGDAREAEGSSVLEQQVRRMLRDPRANALVDGFATRWLELSKLAALSPTRSCIPSSTRTCAKRWRRRRSCSLAISFGRIAASPICCSADYTFANERLAQHYGIPNVYGSHSAGDVRRSPARRPARAGERADGDLVSESHVGRHARQLAAGEHARRAAAAAAARCAGAEGTRRRKASRSRCASGWSCTARTRPARRAISGWIRSALRWRTSTRSESGAPRPTARRSTRPRRCPTARSSPASQGCGAISSSTRKISSERSAASCSRMRSAAASSTTISRPFAKSRARPRANDYRWSSVILGIVKSTPFSMAVPGAKRRASRAKTSGEERT